MKSSPLPDAVLPDLDDTILNDSGNVGPAQRRKISRFGLADLFDTILVEGEVGFGKPDQRIYNLALEQLTVAASDAWMVGDNLEWDIAPAQKLGLFAAWIDSRSDGVPQTSAIRPDRVVRSLSELKGVRHAEVCDRT